MTREVHTFTEPQPPRGWATVNTAEAPRYYTAAGAVWDASTPEDRLAPPYGGRYATPRDITLRS